MDVCRHLHANVEWIQQQPFQPERSHFIDSALELNVPAAIQRLLEDNAQTILFVFSKNCVLFKCLNALSFMSEWFVV